MADEPDSGSPVMTPGTTGSAEGTKHFGPPPPRPPASSPPGVHDAVTSRTNTRTIDITPNPVDVPIRAEDGLRVNTEDNAAIAPLRPREETARPVEAMLRDPLSEVGRKERRSLLAVSMVAILVGHTGLVPVKIENLGITFSTPERDALLWVAMAVVFYYAVAFIVYAFNDGLAFLHTIHLGGEEIRRQRHEAAAAAAGLMGPNTISTSGSFPPPPAPSVWRMIRLVSPASRARLVFDYVVPILVAGYALLVLLGATHSTVQPKSAPARVDGSELLL